MDPLESPISLKELYLESLPISNKKRSETLKAALIPYSLGKSTL
jgi:hypothetical protein